MRRRRLIVSLVSLIMLAAGTDAVLAAPSPAPSQPVSAKRQFAANHRLRVNDRRISAADKDAESGSEVLEGSAQWSEARTSPGVQVPGAALAAADAQAGALPVRGGAWSQVTTGTYNNDAPGYADPVWSNFGAGWGLVSGRSTALATDGRWLYAGFADGGVWTSHDGGRHWRPAFQDQVTASIGALWVDPSDHSLWVGTGEANTSSDSYAGQGIWRSTDHGDTFQRVGGTELQNDLTFSVTASDRYVFAATSRGLWRRGRHDSRTTPWRLVLKPDPNPTNSPYQTSFITDVAIRPGSSGQNVLAVVGWRGGSDYNGFYLSTGSGAAGSFTRIAPQGLDNSDIGRTSLAYTPKGDALYAVIQSPKYTNEGPPAPAQSTALKGVYVSANGDPNGPWTLVADSAKLARSGSALSFPSTYEPGIQTWYDEYIKVDPSDPKHLYLGLEEIFESRDGGQTWHAIGPYWNLVPQCYTPPGPDRCPSPLTPTSTGSRSATTAPCTPATTAACGPVPPPPARWPAGRSEPRSAHAAVLLRRGRADPHGGDRDLGRHAGQRHRAPARTLPAMVCPSAATVGTSWSTPATPTGPRSSTPTRRSPSPPTAAARTASRRRSA